MHWHATKTAKLGYDILVIEVGVSGNEVALPVVTSTQMRDDRCVHNRILRRKTARALIATGVAQHHRVEWNQFGGTQQPGRYLAQAAALLLGAADKQVGDAVKPAQLSGVGCGSSKLLEFLIQVCLRSSALLMTSREGLVRFGQTKGRDHEAHLACFAETQDTLATRRLLLLKGKFQYKIRLDVDVHTTASYSMRPSRTAVSSPDSTSMRCASVLSSALRIDRITSPIQAPTSSSNA